MVDKESLIRGLIGQLKKNDEERTRNNEERKRNEIEREELAAGLDDLCSDDVLNEKGETVGKRPRTKPVEPSKVMSAMIDQNSTLVRIKQENKELEEDFQEEHGTFTTFIGRLQDKLERLEKIAIEAGANRAAIALAMCDCNYKESRCSKCAEMLED